MSTSDALKKQAAQAAFDYLHPKLDSDTIIGVGTGSTTEFFIDLLGKAKGGFDGAVSSSERSTQRLKSFGIPVYDLNSVGSIPFYVDGADAANRHLELIKGGGGAQTREKLIASVASTFLCIVDESKMTDLLGDFPVPIEVLPMARSYVAREIVKLGGDPEYREGFVTDEGNIILDIHNLKITQPTALEHALNHITGAVCNGIFAARRADRLFIAKSGGVEEVSAP